MMRELDHKSLLEALHYNPETGVFTWKKRPRSHFSTANGWLMCCGRDAGKLAGRTGPSGYLSIRIFGKLYVCHRLAWLYVHGSWPDHEIDHINHVRSDNRIANLRQVTHHENTKNTSMRSDNTSGIVGVNWDKINSKWRAEIRIMGRQKNLGRFEDFFEAACVRKQAENVHGFHANHGAAL